VHDRRRFVKAKVWSTEERPSFFPEVDDPELAVPWLDAGRRSFGVAFSGGSTRSAAATLGQLRGLRAAGLLERVGYISAVSGGAWAATPYTYLDGDYDESTFLGPARAPGELRVSDFNRARKRSLSLAISESVLVDDIVSQAIRFAGDELFSRVVGNVFLGPFGLGDREKLFSFHEGARDAVVRANGVHDDARYFLTEDDLLAVRPGRPYLIVGATILRLQGTGHGSLKIPCEFTPLYSGVRRLFPSAGRGGASIGGGYVESFAYDSESPIRSWGAERWYVKIGRRGHRFTLADMIGSSGAAPQEVLKKAGLDFVGFPEFRHWPIQGLGRVGQEEYRQEKYRQEEYRQEEYRQEEYRHSDGGHLENLGIMPLLARQVENIVVFINTKTPFEPAKGRYNDSIAPLFLPVPDREPEVTGAPGGGRQFSTNVVFKNGKKRLVELLAALQAKKDRGEPLVVCETYDVEANDNYAVRPYTARICWVYNERVPTWEKPLSEDVKTILKHRHLKRFPHYRSFFENPPKIIDLTRTQVNALAHLTCWTVTSSAEEIAGHFGF